MADQGDLDQAFRLCETYLNQHPTHACGHYLMGMLYQAAGNNRKAERHLDKAVYLDPSHLAAMEQLSLIAEHRGDAVKAARLRKRAGRIMNREIGP
jgi:chemotaxis protein methyltransferase WspC